MEGKTSSDWGLVAELFEAPAVVVLVDEGGDGGAELGEAWIGAAVDELLLEGAVEALDDAVVSLGRGEGGAVRGKQAVRAHEAQDAVATDLVSGDEMEARVNLAMAFADEGRIGEIGADESQQRVIVEGGFRPAFGVDFRRRQKGIRRRW